MYGYITVLTFKDIKKLKKIILFSQIQYTIGTFVQYNMKNFIFVPRYINGTIFIDMNGKKSTL